jgi:hypothetical protein
MKDNITELQAKPHGDDDYVHAAHLMKERGRFASAIADAYFAADRYNRARLRAAFPDLFTLHYNLYLRQQNEREQS